MEILIAILIIATVGGLVLSKKPKTTYKRTTTTNTENLHQTETDNKKDYTTSYKSKWLFSYNEKDAYRKIREVTDKLELDVFAKVRLFDLIEPRPGCDSYKGAIGKIQAKHVDFVICDSKLVARYIIELDDGSHKAEARQERDTFVNAVLTNCGYKVMHTEAIDPEKLEAWLTE